MGKLLRITITLAVVVAAIIAGRWVWDHYLYSPWTRDGRVRANIVTIAPDVSGWVKQLDVQDNQNVHQGDMLFAVDDTRYQAALAELQAQLESKKYAWDLATHKYERRKQLTGRELISEEDLETARINTEQAKADYDLVQAELNTARINLQRTAVKAPEDGTIINLTLRQGNYVKQGTAVLSLVQSNSFYVTGYFEETKLPLIHVGQKAKISLMSGGHPLTGTVTSIGKAIADTNVSSNGQLLPEIQQTFNWVRLAQRIPVDIKLDTLPDNVSLSAGMTVSIFLQDK
ncbi:HlyD family secretion protein [Shewanella yunxiaonensis]|uniref:HlyD family secretion protein n=1 Tax=Shewanella yunxiaonensis TaxID=2829809 RepID=A0ABX7YV25_9GAMM|nr:MULTISPECIES: HlyD family secretion protein [Shewanella]MDF0533276.1 HlyD family secretion protein [Shewanella sp. A32]QUN06609.1 HlyD family secretion protein [Shewanella yunxiaonensis]